MQTNYIYGAGKLAEHVLNMCKATGIEIQAIIDPKKNGSEFEGLPVINFAEINPGSKVLIAVLNNFVNIDDTISLLRLAGVDTILTPPEVFFDFGARGIVSEWYWLSTNKAQVFDLAEKTRNLLNPLLDDFSAATLNSILNYRCFGKVDNSYLMDIKGQYFTCGIENFWQGDVKLLDGGSFDGDTLLAALNYDISLSKVLAFEPDPENYAKLLENSAQIHCEVQTFQAGLSDRSERVSFDFTAGTGSTISSSGTEENTQLLDFDSLAPNNEVTHIKLDVEGAEFKALSGMKNTIASFNPKMAISVYHKPDDLFELTKLVMKLGKYNTFSLRNYAHQSFETIFYAALI